MPEQDRSRNPFEGITDYFSEMNRLRQTGTHGRDLDLEGRQRTHASAWLPPTDIYARGDDLVIKVELAGLSPEEVNLGFSQGVLTISGNRPIDPEIEDDSSFYVHERFYGEFRRVIGLPQGIAPSQITAVFDDGLVEITVQGALQGSGTSRIELQTKSKEAKTRTLG
jgi:HSP20 family protein